MSDRPQIPGYELTTLLGGGPLTEVFAAREERTGRQCALKRLREGWQMHPTAVQLIRREARVGLTVRHPHLVRILNAHVARPPFFLVMELVPGASVRARLDGRGPLDPRSAVWIARQSAEALAALHSAGYVHGDIKPDNLRLTEDGRTVVVDLGFAHRPGELAVLRERGCLLGTLNYLAPELAEEPFHDGYAADAFSLGVTLFELLTGRLPFPARSPEGRCTGSTADTTAAGTLAVTGVRPSLVRLVRSLLSLDPRARPRMPAILVRLLAEEIHTLCLRRSA